MPSSHLSVSRHAAAVADRSALDRLPPAGAAHDDVRRYSRARRNLLPRSEQVTAVTGGWAHEVVLRSGTTVEAVLWCPGSGAIPRSRRRRRPWCRARGAVRISERTLARIHPGAQAPALLSVVRLPRWPVSRLRAAGAGLVLVADGIEYAGNLGTLIRTADACAVDALVLTRATARLTHPKTFVASRGTVLTTPGPRVRRGGGRARRPDATAGFTTYVADAAGTTSYRDAGLGSGAHRRGRRLGGRGGGRGVAERADAGLDPDAAAAPTPSTWRRRRRCCCSRLVPGGRTPGPPWCETGPATRSEPGRRARADGPGRNRPPAPGSAVQHLGGRAHRDLADGQPAGEEAGGEVAVQRLGRALLERGLDPADRQVLRAWP